VKIDAIAQALNVTPRRISQLVAEGMPRAAHGDYELGPCMSWFIRYLQRALEARNNGQDGTITALTTMRTRVAREMTERMATANREARGKVLVAEDVRTHAQAAIAHLAQDLAPVPAAITDDPTLQARIEDELRLARERFAAGLAPLLRGPATAKRRKD
jgi:phage terminase Nu1 subunit (DNA packaging protein)